MGQDHSRDLLFLLNDVARLIRVEADKRARARGMTRAQWIILIRVERTPGLSQRDLAELLEVEPITVGRLVDRLAARNLIERRPDAADRRIWRLHLTAAAAPLLAEIEGHRQDLRHLILDGIAPAAQETMVDALGRMKANLTAPDKNDNQKDVA
jgi:MarR family transcriptional regulator, transcriptional regulator for hemolysin